jgi:diguanylate cyclase (GGDEF)-like protein
LELTHIAEHHFEGSIVDSLTGLYNRRHLDDFLRRELRIAQREHYSVGIMFLDLDRFKTLNDTLGHIAADASLRAVSDLLRTRLRASDVACRYGGDEIVIVLPHALAQDTMKLAEQLREGIEQLAIEFNGKCLPPVTATFGVAMFPEHGVEPEALLHAADSALRRAKVEGRNRVVCAT